MAAITFPAYNMQRGESFGSTAEAAIVSKYACVLEGSARGTVIECAGAGGFLGFVQLDGTAAALGDKVEVYYSGIVWAVASAAIAIYALCGPAAAGEIVTAGDTVAICCKALLAADAADDVIPVLIVHGMAAA